MPSPLLNSLTSLSQLGQVIHDKSEKGKAFQTLAVDRIYSKAQPRTVFENLEELAESLMRILICVNGVLKHVNTPDSYLRERCANIGDSVRSLA